MLLDFVYKSKISFKDKEKKSLVITNKYNDKTIVVGVASYFQNGKLFKLSFKNE
jgi:hypothetical protein